MYTALFILAGLILLVAILGFFVSGEYHVFRKIIINRPKTEVYHVLKSLEYQNKWSVWASKDPDMKRELLGNDGTVGALSKWSGNKEVGEGEQEITKLIPYDRIETQLRFFKPWKSQSDAYFDCTTIDESTTEVTWGFSGSNKFPANLMFLFMSMDNMVGKDFEMGLQNFKNLIEK